MNPQAQAENQAIFDKPATKPPSDSYLSILKIATPLVLSFTGYMLMQLVDALFLAWYSEEAVAAVVPAAMACYLVVSLFMGVAGYTSTFVAQYEGAGRKDRVSVAVWQGLYFALGAGVFAAALALLADVIFGLFGHAPAVLVLEVEYFQILIVGSPLALIMNAVAGFFTGRGDTKTLALVHFLAIVLNGILDYGMIFGAFGFPAMGVGGAALATVIAQSAGTIFMVALFFRSRHRATYGTWRHRAFDLDLFKRLLRFGFPSGLRITLELLAWTGFLVFVGRLGARELAVTNIVWRINGIAFFPLFGLSATASILVGQAQGANRPDLSLTCIRKCLLLGEAWMLICAVLYLVFPVQLLQLFHDPNTVSLESFQEIREMGIVLLRFVALYCVVDALNIVTIGALQGAGDTRWTLTVGFIMYGLFLAALVLMDRHDATLTTLWLAATAFVLIQAVVWLWRIVSGRWKEMRVIEPVLVGETG